MLGSACPLLLDPLSLFFGITIFTLAIPTFIYSFGYLRGHYSLSKIWMGQILFVIFILSMLAVVTVGNAFAFLIVWEIMSLSSYFLVVFDSTNKKSIEAGTIYLVMTHIGTALLTIAFLLMYKHCGSFDFSVLHNALISLPERQKDIIFLLLLFGFGTKAGIVPLHIWLPYAHPQAPSHISSLMSGVMIKTALYGIIRFIILILGVNSLWWGELVIVLACISCLVGVIYALMEQDIKTLLAYSSVENIGIILLGIGSSMLFLKLGASTLAILAMTAGLYHLINHAVFKGLLFLGAGSIYNATGTRNIEKLGGLIKSMPWTAAYFLIGSMAISALPPINGFISEWLTLIMLFLGALTYTGGMKIFLCFTAAILALTGGLAAACFTKAFGITFLAQPRSARAQDAKESSLSMNIGMGILAFFCIALGLGAAYFIALISSVANFATGLNMAKINFSLNPFVVAPHPHIFLSPLLLSGILIIIAAFFTLGLRLFFGKAKVTIGPTWDCGYYKLTHRNEYTATGFSKPFRLAFSFFLFPFHKVQKIKESRYHIKSFAYETHTTKIFLEYFYKNFIAGIFGTGKYMRNIQAGSIHIYLGYICLTILLLLVFIGWF